jgi:hypothetical protein
VANWLEAAFGVGEEAEPIAPSPRQAPEVKSFVCVVAQPSGTPDDLGETVDAWYFVEDGILMLCDEHGKASEAKPYRLAAGENERAVASRLRRAAWRSEEGRSTFNRLLHYRPFDVA